MTAVNYVFTWNNYTTADVEYLRDLVNADERVKYVCFCKEVAPSTGTPHLQGFLGWKKPARHSATKSILKNNWCQRMYGEICESEAYCSKEDVLESYGTVPTKNVNKCKRARGGEANKKRWSDALVAAKEGRFADVDPEILIRYGGGLVRAVQMSLPAQTHLDGELEHEWICGPPGCGKSRGVWERFPKLYDKGIHQWWDNYMGEEVVLIDDFDPNQDKKLIADFKRWADRYIFSPQVKGGMLYKIRPKKVIVTSNYTIEECFPGRDNEAFRRRFKEVIMQ